MLANPAAPSGRTLACAGGRRGGKVGDPEQWAVELVTLSKNGLQIDTYIVDVQGDVRHDEEDVRYDEEDVRYDEEDVHHGTEDVHHGTEAIHHDVEGVRRGVEAVHHERADVLREAEGVHHDEEDVYHGAAGVHHGVVDVRYDHVPAVDVRHDEEDVHHGRESDHLAAVGVQLDESVHLGAVGGNESVHMGAVGVQLDDAVHLVSTSFESFGSVETSLAEDDDGSYCEVVEPPSPPPSHYMEVSHCTLSRGLEEDDAIDLSADEAPADYSRYPPVPLMHPWTHKENKFDPEAPYDPEALYDVHDLLDRAYDARHRCYLVQWCSERRDFVASWVWGWSLRKDGFIEECNRIDKWKDEYADLTLAEFNKRVPATFTASQSGTCFFEALRMACAVMKQPDLVPLELIERFQAQRKRDAAGVSKADISNFLALARKEKVALAVDKFMLNHAKTSLNTAEDLNRYKLDVGVYVVGATGARGLRHCFALQVFEGDQPRKAFDNLRKSGKRLRGTRKLLTAMTWIRSVQFVRKVERVQKKKAKK